MKDNAGKYWTEVSVWKGGELVAENVYEEYCRQVRRALKKATQKERASFTEELLDHMESHAETLVELGWEPEEARDYSVQAMGDPQMVGRQYDEKLSSFWLVCWYVLRVILIVMAVWIPFIFVVQQGSAVCYNLQARWNKDPVWIDFTYDEDVLARNTLDVEIPLKRHTVRIFRTEIYYEQKWECYMARVYAVCYSNNPFHPGSGLMSSWSGIEGFDGGGGNWKLNSGYLSYYGQVEKGQDHVMFYIENEATDTHVQVKVPLEWEGIP